MNGHVNINTSEATEHLKNILNVGKAESGKVRSETITSNNMASSDSGNDVVFQQVEIDGSEESVAIYGTDVSVYSSLMHQSASSPNIMIDNVVDYGWEKKFYLGRLISIHLSKKYMAYALKAPAMHGFVRVIKHNTNNHVLLRGFRGGAKDLSFAHSHSRVMLGIVDEIGELFVYNIHDQEKCLIGNLCLRIVRPDNTPRSNNHRIIWCPYVPEDVHILDAAVPPDDVTVMMSSLVAVTHDSKAEIWNIDTLMKEYGQGEIRVEDVKTGMQLICEHQEPITAAAFSPDAIALATASLDGEVKFFQVNIQENVEIPKCLHKWKPHDGKPLSSLFFLDNHKSYAPDVQFWKFAITGSENNQELKLWSCKTWECLQTIRIISCDGDEEPCLKADIDLSAGYLFLSDINRMVLYILKIHQEANSTKAYVCSLSEFPVKFPVISFAVMDVCPFKTKPSLNAKAAVDEEDEEDEDDGEKDDEDEDSESDDTERKPQQSYLAKLFWIHLKSLQFCKIVFTPKSKSPLQSMGSISSSQDSFVYRDGLSDMSTDVQDHLNLSVHEGSVTPTKNTMSAINSVLTSPPSIRPPSAVSSAQHRSPGYPGHTEILLTPRDFACHSNLPSVGIGDTYKLSGIQEPADLTAPDEVIEQGEIRIMSPNPAGQSRRKSSQHSSTSSPSREVAEILSPSQAQGSVGECISPDIGMKKENEILNSDDHKDPVICSSPCLGKINQEFMQNDWPPAPDPTKDYKIISRSDGDIQAQLEQTTTVIHTVHASSDGIEPLANISSPLIQRLEKSVEIISHNVATVMDALPLLSQTMQSLQNEVQGIKQQQKYIQTTLQAMGTLDSSISNKVGHIVSESAVSEFARLENLLSNRENTVKQCLEQQSTTLSQNVTTGMSSRLDKIVKQEMKNTVLPHLTNQVNTLVEGMQGDILQKLNSTDNALKECLGKNLKSKTFGETLAQATVTLLQQNLQDICKEVFQNHVVTSLEKCCQLLFSQLNEVFTKGVLEYMEKLEKHQQITASHLEAAITRFKESSAKLVYDTENLVNGACSAKMQANAVEMNRQHEILLSKMKQTIHEEVQIAMREHASSVAAALRSQSSTPAPQNDQQASPQQLVQLIKQGQVNEAFQQALSAVDVKLVLFLCESVSLDQVFGPVPSPLAQHVLLSLIHQLSGDLDEKTELKVRYIEDAITSLDKSNPVTSEHIGRVLGILQRQVSSFVKINPSHKMLRSLKRILLSIDSLLK